MRCACALSVSRQIEWYRNKGTKEEGRERKRAPFLGSKKIPDTIWPGEHFTFMITPFWIHFCISWRTTEYSCSLKAWPRSPLLTRVGRQLNSGSQNTTQNYMISSKIFPCCKSSSDSPRLKIVAELGENCRKITYQISYCQQLANYFFSLLWGFFFLWDLCGPFRISSLSGP